MGFYKPYWKKYKKLYFLAVACILCEVFCDLLQPTVMSRIIDDGVTSGSIPVILRLGLLMLCITAAGAGFAVSRNFLSSTVSQKFSADLRSDLYQKVISLPLSRVDEMGSGSIITRVTNDVVQVRQFVNGMMRFFLKGPATGLGSIVLATVLCPQLSVVLLGAVALVSVFTAFSLKLSYHRYAKVQKAIDHVNTVVQEYLSGIRLVKTFGRFQEEEERFAAVNFDLADKNKAADRVISIFSPLMQLSINFGIVIVLFYGGFLFIHGSVQVGQIVAFTNYMTQILGAMRSITNMFNTFVRTKASSERITEIFRQQDAPSMPTAASHTKIPGYLVFDHVSFAYPNGSGAPVFHNLSFMVNRGETLAVIGPTGSGKSTLCSLLIRFYDVTGGAIYLDGNDIRSIETATLRQKIAIAPQQSMLFSATIAENVRWGNTNATAEQVRRACEAAQADGFICEMPQQYNSLLGQGGVNISGGQKQRISIARALIRRAELLLLDDCTSALDAGTEAKVRHALQKEKGKKPILLVTQRIGTAMAADRILVLENGKLAGLGSHSHLMHTCQTYRDIYDSQIGGEPYAE